jgi:hypothetical protein
MPDSNLFACMGGMHRAHRAGDVGMSKFMNESKQTPHYVAWFVSECMKLRETMSDLARYLEGYHVDIFSSDGDA